MRGLFCETTAKTNEEYRIVLKKRMKIMIGMIIIGVITAAVALYADFYMHAKVSQKMLGVYTGFGTGLIVAGIILLIKNRLLINNEEKLKESRLNNSDERVQEIVNKSFKAAACVMIVVLYLTALIGGIFIPQIVGILVIVIFSCLLTYMVAFRYYSNKI